MVVSESSSLIRVNNFGPSCRIVSGRSNGRRSYIRPPAKWQGWHRDSRMGLTSRAKSTGLVATAGVGAGCKSGAGAGGVATVAGLGSALGLPAGAWAQLTKRRPIAAERGSTLSPCYNGSGE